MHKALMCILGGVLGFHADALTISPTIIEMSTQSRATAQIRLENSSSKQTSIEVSVRHLVFDRDGNFTVEDTENAELVVFPPAAVLEVGGVQVFRLQWLGKGNLPKSESFFVRFTQPALEPFDNPDSWDKSAGSALAIEIHYNALVHVSSPANRLRLHCVSVVTKQHCRITVIVTRFSVAFDLYKIVRT
ncbi:hypothetical protein AT251_06620 [Enterovibrio nigricans]|nr:fimbria/pilus periplasmic chaperone [Enterovibrio nigricans]PKF51077.1 hypothetical protein AT251_06620 [Enterovibrio nigricans]